MGTAFLRLAPTRPPFSCLEGTTVVIVVRRPPAPLGSGQGFVRVSAPFLRSSKQEIYLSQRSRWATAREQPLSGTEHDARIDLWCLR